MRIMIDCDVLLDVGLRREPHFDASARLLDWAERRPGQGAVAWHSISNLFYLTGGKATTFIEELARFVEIPETGSRALGFALQLEMGDLEDAMQVAAAERFNAQLIATRNLKHFRKSPIRALSPAEILGIIGGG